MHKGNETLVIDHLIYMTPCKEGEGVFCDTIANVHDLRQWSFKEGGGEGVRKSPKMCDVVNEQSPLQI